MNSQILKLARKSGATVDQGFDGTKNFVYGITMSPEELDKFAQLIVRECADIANRQFSAATGLDDRDCLTAHQMKQHFGVEE